MLNRRNLLISSVAMGMAAKHVPTVFAQDNNIEPSKPLALAALDLTGEVRHVHDPVIIKQDKTYYVYSTGSGVPTRMSNDLIDWKRVRPGAMPDMPKWLREYLPNAKDVWAPDIAFFNNKYYMYYSASTFGSNRSCIGLQTNASLDMNDPAYRWEDQGMVVASESFHDYNCIDPNLVIDADGNKWLAFGSFWSGIKMRRLNNDTGLLSNEDDKLYPLATRFVNSGAIEAPCIVRKGSFYYLFASFDVCCRGIASTYHVMVGRSESVTGPYVDRDGMKMLEGGGTQVTFPNDRWRGPGHNSILRADGKEWLVFHAYDALAGGVPTLRVVPLQWNPDGWPFISGT